MIKLYFIALTSAFIVALLLTPLSMVLARRFGVLDQPDPRKIHAVPKPRWGGIGIFGGFLAGLFMLWLLFPPFEALLRFTQPILRDGRLILTLNLGEQLAGILLGAIILFTAGLMDDRKGLPAGMKFLIQIIAAYVAMTYGVRILGISVPGFESYSNLPLWAMQVVTVLWLVGMTNAMNLVDGMDGLAAGLTAIVAAAFLAVTLLQEKGPLQHLPQMKLAGLIAACLFGSTTGFLVYNFYPSHLFMGDSGSLVLGFLVGCVAVTGTFKTTIFAVLLVPFFLVVIPVADMTIAFLRRSLKRQSPFAPDRGHFHHRLLDSGWTQREVVLLVYVVTLLLALISVTVVGARKI